jgi:DNA/RNA-binding domain of Phe-tRNA-synthetase-like protein
MFQQVMANHGVIHSQESLLRRVLNDEKLLGFESVDEAAFLSLQLIIGAADTVRLRI